MNDSNANLPPRKRVLNLARLLDRLSPAARIALATGNPLTGPRPIERVDD